MKKNIYLNIFLFFIALVILSSCVSRKKIAYFQKGSGSDTIDIPNAYIPKVQSGDILSITVGSLNPAASSFFNPFSATPLPTDNGNAIANSAGNLQPQYGSQSSAPGYLVDVNGAIELPLLGSIKVQDLTTLQVKDMIKERIKEYLKEPTVNVRFLNYKVSIMGEVTRPSVYVIPNEKVTLPEALSIAGDITIFGRRDNVLVIRDNNGKKEFGHVDLTTRDLYTSPYYYLHANDVIYIEPTKGRIAQTDKTYQLLPVLISALSFISIIIAYSTRR